MTIKVQCPCGSKYSFDVEPVDGRMPFTVQCPNCQADGTELANQILAETESSKPKLRMQAAAAPPGEAPQVPIAPRPPLPVAGAAMRKIQRERAQFRMIGWIAAGVALIVAALVGYWIWFEAVGSKPGLEYSVKISNPDQGWDTGFLDTNNILLVNPNKAVDHNLNTSRDSWTADYSDKSGGAWPARTYYSKDSIWVFLGNRVVRIDRASGVVKQTVPIAGEFPTLTASDTDLLIVSTKDETNRLVCRIDLASGGVANENISVPRSEKHAMPNELPSNVAPTAGVLLSQALEEQKFNKPLDAMSSEFFSAGVNLVELRVKLLEPKVVYEEAIKPRGPTHINGSLTAGSSAADVAEEVFNDIKRSQTGGVKGIDQSRYQTTLRRWLGDAKPAEWTGEVIGVPAFFPLKTVDLLVAGQQLAVFDKANKKLFDARLAYPINERYRAEMWDRVTAPGVEAGGSLYFYDEGVLTAFSLPAGEVRWRLTSVGVSKVQPDGNGNLYVNTTSKSPDEIKYSEQIKFDKAAALLLKVDAASGKILWQSANHGQAAFLSGPYLYCASADRGGVAMANGLAEALNAPQQDAPTYFHIYRIDPGNGKVLWDFYRDQAPQEFSFEQNRFLVRMGAEVQVWKFLTSKIF